MLEKLSIPGVPLYYRWCYQPFLYFTYWLVLVCFNNCYIITSPHKATQNESFEDIHHVFIDIISDNMAALFNLVNMLP